MKTLKLTLLGLGLILAPRAAYPQGTTFTQVGYWSCTIPSGAAAGYACPAVAFPTVFGGVPNIVVTGPAQATNVTANGFTPVAQQANPPVNNPFPGGPPLAVNLPISGTWVAVGPVLLTGTAQAKYVVLTVIYSPPGTNGGHSTSSVSYSAGSTTGTTTSASESFQAANSISFTGSASYLGSSGSIGVSFSVSQSDTDSQSLTIQKSATSAIAQAGPSVDGINHDQDEIWLLLNPTLNLAVSTVPSASWNFSNSMSPVSSPIQYLYVGWLNGDQQMPAPIATLLQNAGITPQDYPTILARDPFATSAPIDQNRFLLLNTTFPYEPPLTATDPVPTQTYNVTNSSTSTTGSETVDTYKVGLTITASPSFLGLAKATLKDSASWQWTNKSSQTNTTGSSESASLTIGGPAYGYTGSTVMEVYFDTMYKTFAFALAPLEEQEIGVQGTLTDQSGNLLTGKEVTLTAAGVNHQTFTNSKGEFKFFGHINGPVTVQAAGVQATAVPQATSTIRSVKLSQH
jgi:hypothetical protein